MRKRGMTGMIAVTALSAALSMQSVVYATPAEELNGILEKQFKTNESSLLENTIGFSQLAEEMKENGLYLDLSGELMDGTAQLLGVSDAVPEGSSLHLNLQIDPVLKKWLFQFGLNRGIDPLVDLSLYGDREQLALTLPQFFEGAIGIRSGSFKEQYEGSALQLMLEGEEPSEVPEIELKFYPENAEASAEEENAGLKGRLEDKTEELQQDMKAEKTEEGDLTVYTVVYRTQDIVDIYRIVLEEYFGIFENSGLMVNSDVDSAREDMEQMLDQISSVMGDEVEIHFTVQNDLVEKISYELYCDTTELVQKLQESESEAEAETGEEEEVSSSLVKVNTTVEEAEEFQGYLNYEMTFADPSQPLQAFDFCMTVEDLDRNEMGTFCLEKETVITDNSSETTMHLEITDEGEVQYSDTPVTVSFNAGTGDLDAVFKMSDEDTTVAMNLSSTFSEVEKGQSFCWTINQLSLEADGEKAGVQGVIQAAARPQEFEVSQNEKMILELSDSELMSLLAEIMVNAQSWAAQFEPETEIEEIQ